MYVLYLLKCKQKTYISSLSHHFQANLQWRSKLYSGAWWGTRSGHRYHIFRILHPWQDFLLSLLNVTISSCCTLPGIGRNLRRNIVEHLQLKWNKCWHVHYLKEVGCWWGRGGVNGKLAPDVHPDLDPSHLKGHAGLQCGQCSDRESSWNICDFGAGCTNKKFFKTRAH